MIGTSFAELIFIRVCVTFLQLIVPLCFVYFFVQTFYPQISIKFVDQYCAAEAAFLIFYLFYRRGTIQKPADHPPLPSPLERKNLFEKTLTHIADPEKYLSQWFHQAPVTEIYRENAKEFLSWAFLNSERPTSAEEDAELDEYVDIFDKRLSRPLRDGYNPAVRSLRVTLDKVKMSHRSLAWYGMVSVVDLLSSARLAYSGFTLYPTASWFSTLPLRPQSLVLSHGECSPARNLSYWYRSPANATDEKKLPIIFLHGLGIGVYPYVPFLRELSAANPDVSILFVEMMPISMRITAAPLTPEEFTTQLSQILVHHGIKNFTLLGHSYGSVLSTHLLHSRLAPRITNLVLLDPVVFLLHLPSVAYNFTARKPQYANEHQLSYFAARDPGIAHTIARHLFWAQAILWTDDPELKKKRWAVVMGGRDLIVDSQAVRSYLVNSGSKVLWFDEADHGQCFDTRQRRAEIVKLVGEVRN